MTELSQWKVCKFSFGADNYKFSMACAIYELVTSIYVQLKVFESNYLQINEHC